MSRPWLDISKRILLTNLTAISRTTQQHRHASRLRASIPPAYPHVDSCPAPTCTCRPMPSGLDIDYKQPLNGTMAPYAEQILISTGKGDWTSRIEEDEGSGMVRGLKGLLGRGGKFSDPYHNVLITNSSFRPSSSASGGMGSAFLFPSFRFIPEIPLDRNGLERFVRGFVLPKKLHQMHNVLSEEQKRGLMRAPSLQDGFHGVRSITETTVLICGHGGRDSRCGTMGPLLNAEFEDQLDRQGYQVLTESSRGEDASAPTAQVGLISHIGGHKYAGNVIMYIPPTAKTVLAGCGIWYGRVKPENVEGIVRETLLQGRIVKDLCRGGIAANGSPILL